MISILWPSFRAFADYPARFNFWSPAASAFLIPHRLAQFSTTITKRMPEFKLKGLSSLDLEEGEKVEVEVEGIEKGKVLLVKVAGKVHALNSNCTHFGAPLKNGVLSPDGRLTCPWHGGM
jgi:Rieske Fe-S protein